MRDRNLNPPRSAKPHSERNVKRVSTSNLNAFFNKKNSFLFRNKETFALFIKCIGEIQLRARKDIFFDSFLDLFVLDPEFDIVCGMFAQGIFEDVISLISRTKNMLEDTGLMEEDSHDFREGFDQSSVGLFTVGEQKMFLNAKYVLDYYKNQLVFCKLVVAEKRVNERGETSMNERKYNARKKIKMILSRIVELFDFNTGILGQCLNSQIDLMSKLAKNNRFKTIKNIPNLSFNLNLMFNLYHSIFDILALGFCIKSKYSEFLSEANVNHYIRMCYLNFVKIYSYISNAEITKINQKVMRKLNEEKLLNTNTKYKKNTQTDDTDKQETAHKKNSFPIVLSKIYLKVVINIALYRNEAIKNIFYQFRVMEFFYKEIDLEFEISQIKERFIKVRNDFKENLSRGTSPKKMKEEDFRKDEEPSTPQTNKADSRRSGLREIKASGPIPIVGLKLNLNSMAEKKDNPYQYNNVQYSQDDSSDTGEQPPPSSKQKMMIPQMKLNLASINPHLGKPSKDSSHHSITGSAKPINSFNLDFSKIQNKVKISGGDDLHNFNIPQPSHNEPLQSSKTIGSKRSSKSKDDNPTIPGIQSIGIPNLSLNQKPIPKLNFGGVPRGNPLNVPQQQIVNTDYIDEDSSDSPEIDIKYDDPSFISPQKPTILAINQLALHNHKEPNKEFLENNQKYANQFDTSSEEDKEQERKEDSEINENNKNTSSLNTNIHSLISKLPLPAFSPLSLKQNQLQNLSKEQEEYTPGSEIIEEGSSSSGYIEDPSKNQIPLIPGLPKFSPVNRSKHAII